MFEIIALDADDTLWHNENLYVNAQQQFVSWLQPYADPETIARRLYEIDVANLPDYGYGIKGFVLSMVEAALDLSDDRIRGSELQPIVGLARQMLQAEVALLDHVAETIPLLAAGHRLMLITKGDLRDQLDKLQRSGLAEHFDLVEVVSDKRTDTYRSLLEYHRLAPDRFLMVGNSLKSDILPVLELGGTAVHIPYELVWPHEVAELNPDEHPGLYELRHLGELPGLLQKLEAPHEFNSRRRDV